MHMAWKQSGKTMWGFRYLVLFTLCLPWMAQAGSNIYYVHSDHLGTPQKLTNQSAQVVWEANHKPFGEADIDADVDGDGQVVEFNLRFQGQYYDQYTGANYNYYRDYDPSTGRYLQSDPIGLQGGFNTYSYVDGNPIAFVDPFGLIKWGGKFYSLTGGYRGATAGKYIFSLESECVDGKKYRVRVNANGFGAGIGATPVASTGGKISLEDGLSAINPDVFNGEFVTVNATYSFGIGYSYSATRIGGAKTSGGSIVAGVEIGIAEIGGESEVVRQEVISCSCE